MRDFNLERFERICKQDKAVLEVYEYYIKLAHKQERMLNNKAEQLCKESGLDPTLLGIHPHNSLVSLHYGKPWGGIDYDKVLKCKALLDRQFDGNNIVGEWYSERMKQIRSK